MRFEKSADSIRGFGAAVSSLDDWLTPGPCLGLPEAMDELAELEPGARQIRVDAWVEAMGALEPRLRELAGLSAEGSRLVLSVKHSMAPSLVRSALEGRPSGLDPRPALGERELAFSVPRLAAALSRSGWIVEDLCGVHYWDSELPFATVEALLKNGIAAARYLIRVPPERLWVRARRGRTLAGSVLIAAGPGQAMHVQRTVSLLETFLPPAWEIVEPVPAEREAISWNRALTRSRGDQCWLLRGGDLPGREQFESTRAAAISGPVLASAGGEGERQGLGGAMLERATFLDVGPLPEEIDSDLVMAEEWVMRASAANHPMETIRLECPGPGAPVLPGDAEEAERLLERWSDIGQLPNPGDPLARPVETPPWIREGREPRISLCMIARDEEELLPGCLTRVRDLVDEIVLVDTGSSDRTVEIAASFGARVLSRAWDGDFSAPRNLALEHAKGDWILVLDADEFLEADSVPAIRRAAHNARACGFHLTFKNDFEEGRTRGVTMVRLFRNLPGLRYEYRIHEQVIPSLMRLAEPSNLGLHPLDAVVIHYGYSASLMDGRGKRERNTRLFRDQLREDPEDLYMLYKYGDFLRMLGGHQEEVIEVFERALRLLGGRPPGTYRDTPFAAEISALLALELTQVDRSDEADAVLRQGLRSFMPTPNLHYVAAGVAVGSGRFDEALDHYQRCLAYRDQVLVVPIQEGITSWVSLTGMAQCWLGLGDPDRAEDLLSLAIHEKPDWEVSHLVLSGAKVGRGDLQAALEVLMGYLSEHGESGSIRFQGGMVLEQMGLWHRAGEWYDKALQEGTVDETQLRRQAGGAWLAAGDLDRARGHWSEAAGDDVASGFRELLDRIEGKEEPEFVLTPSGGRALMKLRKNLEQAGQARWVARADELLAAGSLRKDRNNEDASLAQEAAWAHAIKR
ncbi:MAG: glycosyltransferase [Planctomycetota bacterium]